MIKNCNVHGLPLSSFYRDDNRHLGESGIRYKFVKVMKIGIIFFNNMQYHE